MSDTTPAISSIAADRGTRASVHWTTVVKVAVLVLLMLKLYLPQIDHLTYKWRTDGNWSHGWLVPVFSVYFLLVHREQLLAATRKANYLGLVILILGLAMLFVAQKMSYGYPQQFSLVVSLLGLVLLLYGWRVFSIAWFPIAFLVFAIPLPQDKFFLLTLPLRRIASVVAGTLLGLLPDVYTEVQGVVVDYEYKGRMSALNVEEACSGMRLMMAFCSLGVAMAYLGDRPLWHRVVMVLSCIPIAVFCNTLRVIMTGVAHVYGYEDLAQGTAHQLLGLLMLPIALGLFALVGYVLKNLFVEESAEEAAAE